MVAIYGSDTVTDDLAGIGVGGRMLISTLPNKDDFARYGGANVPLGIAAIY